MVAGVLLLGIAAITSCSTEPGPVPSPSRVTAEPSPAGSPSAPPTMSASPDQSPSPSCAVIDPVTLAVSGPAQARYAGYLASVERGGYAERCLDVTVLDAGEDPLTAISEGRADFAVAPLPDGLRARERGIGVVDVAQVFQRSGTVEVALADSGINEVADFRGHTVAVRRGTDGIEPIAAIAVAGLDPVGDVRVVDDPPATLLLGTVDAAQTTSYDGLASLVESTDPATGAPYRLADFTVISMEEAGTGVLPDAIWAAQDRLADPAYQDLTQRFVTGSLAGWISCRDDLTSCADSVAASGGTGEAAGLAWRINQVNALVWPSPAGVGVLSQEAVDRTVNILTNTKTLDGVPGLAGPPAPEAWTDQYARTADDALAAAGLNVTGDGYLPADLPLGSVG